MSISKNYTKEMRQNLEYSATWFPSLPLSPGDVGVFNNYEFIKTTTLGKLGIEFDLSRPTAMASIDYQSANAVSMELVGAGETTATLAASRPVHAGARVCFRRAHAIVFRAIGCELRRIEDDKALESAIVKQHEKNKWSRTHVVITEVLSAHSTTILISSGTNATIDLEANGLTQSSGLDLAQAGFQVKNESGMGFKQIASGKLTPLFRAKGLRWRLFPGSPRIGMRDGNTDYPEFARVDYSDFDDE